MSLLVTLYLCFASSQTVKLACPQLEEVQKTILVDSWIYMSDSKANRIHQFDTAGKCHAEFGRRGEGPGEFMRLTDFGRYGSQLFILDADARKLIFIDEKMRLIREFKSPWSGTVQKAIAVESDLWLFGFDPLDQNSLKILDAKTGKVKKSFGGSIAQFFKPSNSSHELSFFLSYSNADLHYQDGLIYVLWRYGLALDIYQRDGVLQKRAKLPGSDSDRFYDAKRNRILYEVHWTGMENQEVLFTLIPGPYVAEDEWIEYQFSYNSKSQKWSASKTLTPNKVQGKTWYTIRRNEEDDYEFKFTDRPQLELKPYKD